MMYFQDSQIKDILTTSPTAMTITIMPKFIYEHMIKRYHSDVHFSPQLKKPCPVRILLQ